MSMSLVAIFGAGLLTFASPCVLPLMPIYLATIAGSALDQARPRRTLAMATAFALGLSSVFVLLGALASTLGGLLTEHRTVILLLSGVLMVLFGLRSVGILRIPLLERDVRPGLARVRATSGYVASFVFGAAFALGWSPCIGPVLAAVLTYAAAHAETPWRGAGYLAVYAAGLTVPLLLIAVAATRATAWLARVRTYIPTLERLTGVALLAIGVWTLVDLGRQSFPQPAASATASSDIAAESCDAKQGGQLCALPRMQPAATAQAAPAHAAEGAYMLEFTASECPICQKMRPVIDAFAETCAELGNRFVRVDVASPEGRALADRHRVLGTPTLVLFDDTKQERARLLGEKSANEVALAIEEAFGVSCGAG